jgi:hypothetical protein
MQQLRSSARIMRGFSRIGIGAAVLIAVTGLAITVGVAVSSYKSANSEVKPWYLTPDYEEGIRRVIAERSHQARNAAMRSALIGLGITGATSLAIFGFFRSLGSVVAGFARD